MSLVPWPMGLGLCWSHRSRYVAVPNIDFNASTVLSKDLDITVSRDAPPLTNSVHVSTTYLSIYPGRTIRRPLVASEIRVVAATDVIVADWL